MDMLVELVRSFFDFFQHIPDYLHMWAIEYGSGVYLILAAIVFCETGLVVTPLLPGDSLLFAAGALVSLNIPGLNLPEMGVILIVSALCGDLVNYHFGKWLGPKVFANYEARWLNRKHLEKTRSYFSKHGGKTIVIARFIPIVRTYAPFVGGLSGMRFSRFLLFSVTGAVTWVTLFLGAGYIFGNIPSVKSNFQYVVMAIIVLSLAPVAIEFLKSRQSGNRTHVA